MSRKKAGRSRESDETRWGSVGRCKDRQSAASRFGGVRCAHSLDTSITSLASLIAPPTDILFNRFETVPRDACSDSVDASRFCRPGVVGVAAIASGRSRKEMAWRKRRTRGASEGDEQETPVSGGSASEASVPVVTIVQLLPSR